MGRTTQEFGKGKKPRRSLPFRHAHGEVHVHYVVESEFTKWVRGIKIVGAANGAAFLAGRLRGWW